MADVTSQELNETGAIMNNLPGRAMRVAMENKNLLAAKGQLYAGTGSDNSFSVAGMDGGTESYSISRTAATPAPPSSPTASASNPYVLVYTGEGTTGVKWMLWSQLKNL